MSVTTPPRLEVREVQLRAATEDGKREFSGIAVPWNSPARIGWQGYTEEFERGAVQDSDDAIVLYRHNEPVGRITEARDTDAGWEITGVLSATPRGDEVYTLLRDGVIKAMSVGFEPVEHREVRNEDDDSLSIIRTNVRVREVSLVPFPAYKGATVEEVRSAQTTPDKENPMTAPAPEFVERAAFDTLRESNEELERRFEKVIATLEKRDQTPAPSQYRTAGALLKAIASGDEVALREYQDVQERAWSPAGTTTAESVSKDGWVGDFTRLVEEKATLRNLFSSGPLPAEGMNLEFGVLEADTTQVTEQATQGADLGFGIVKVTTDTAPVKTFGGYTRLSLQAIQRSSVAILDHHLRALDLAANRRRNVAFRAHYAEAVAAQITAGNTVAVPATGADYVDWVSAIVDAAEIYEDNGLDLQALVVDKTGFKELAGLTATDGRPLLTVHGTGTNVVGEINAPGISGNLAGVRVQLNPKQTAPGAAFINNLAIRSYTSGIARLQDDNIINLSRDFSVYYYESLADEIPAGIVPVERTA
ncbi:HK97 family phage prohead protease [Oerskovia sp. NPDC060338]|uniref:HK97 family phage prohead protease n=1 Tax=Oerskovia sp. NPDC060338 TaxID=3347100 RepID=UPI00365972EA